MNSKKRFLLSVLGIVVVLLVIYTPVDRSDAPVNDDTLARIQRTGILDVCTVVYPPSVIKDATSEALTGHFVDAMNIIVERMGIKVTWHESTWGNAAADLQSKRCDLVAAAFFANIPRAASVAFTNPPLFYVGESALVRKDDVRFQSVNDIFVFDKADITVAVATGESGDVFVKENFKNAKVNRIDVESSDLARFAVEVSVGRADVAIADANTISLYAQAHSEVVDVFKNNPFGLNPVGWAVRQDDVRWLHFIESALQFLETQGTFVELESKYNAHWIHEVKQFQLQ